LGTKLDSLYPAEEYKWLNYKEIDEIVHGYKDSVDEKSKKMHRAGLLRAFHKYFMKYVSLLKGTIGSTSISNSDTVSFLALFLTGEKSSHDYLGIYKYVIHVCKQIDDVDIYNELVAMFILLLDKFEFYPEVSFSRYITKYMRWSIKAWVMEMARNPLNRSPVEYEPYLEDTDEGHSTTINTELPNMDLAWVSKASSPLFSILTRYERFLLYLNYKEGLGVRQISERLGRAKDTIHAHLQQALQKLREQYKKGEQ
jgi:RNA polymerase sigma factor (sigma-70 family)